MNPEILFVTAFVVGLIAGGHSRLHRFRSDRQAMTTLLRHFYAFMIWATELELALARQSGNMENINRLTGRLNYWTVEAQRFEWRLE